MPGSSYIFLYIVTYLGKKLVFIYFYIFIYVYIYIYNYFFIFKTAHLFLLHLTRSAKVCSKAFELISESCKGFFDPCVYVALRKFSTAHASNSSIYLYKSA